MLVETVVELLEFPNKLGGAPTAPGPQAEATIAPEVEVIEGLAGLHPSRVTPSGLSVVTPLTPAKCAALMPAMASGTLFVGLFPRSAVVGSDMELGLPINKRVPSYEVK